MVDKIMKMVKYNGQCKVAQQRDEDFNKQFMF